MGSQYDDRDDCVAPIARARHDGNAVESGS
jgi:hypothetical protein